MLGKRLKMKATDNAFMTKQVDSEPTLAERYTRIRNRSAAICEPLAIEDYVVQPVVDVSPPKWHLGHTTWFFETFVLIPHLQNYRVFDVQYNYVFNSYYETIGARVIRTDRGNLKNSYSPISNLSSGTIHSFRPIRRKVFLHPAFLTPYR